MPAPRTYHPDPSLPTLRLPRGACDTHVHVFGPAALFPFAATSTATAAGDPADASKETLFALHHRLGIGRCVIVQSVVHGFDNRAVEDAIQAGNGRYLGVALVPVDVAEEELARLATAGFRGVRFNFMRPFADVSRVDAIVAFTRRLAPFGMHLQVQFDSELIHVLAPSLARSAVPVVIDHVGRVDASLGPTHADFAALHETMKNPLFRVKVSGVDRISRDADYADGVALARKLVQDFPERCLWGTDWPHPNHDHVPDDGKLVDALARIAPDPASRELLLIDNPRRFYRFDA